jgi:galactokinase/mevalonate kinase-like predicted kinase
LRPNLILDAEKELGIVAGLQDRVAQVYGGLVYMVRDTSIHYLQILARSKWTSWVMAYIDLWMSTCFLLYTSSMQRTPVILARFLLN